MKPESVLIGSVWNISFGKSNLEARFLLAGDNQRAHTLIYDNCKTPVWLVRLVDPLRKRRDLARLLRFGFC
jgi:hypothetical protein